jgi:molybdopterin biosynthesis enzyme
VVHAALAAYERRYGILPASRAAEIVLAQTPILSTERVRTVEAQGRVLAETVVSSEQMPPFPAATVDGYAVLADDPAEWRTVLSDVLAGQADGARVGPGATARIMTGAPLPPGADAVVMFEQTDEREDRVRLKRPVRRGDNLRPVGIDLEVGQTVLAAGALLGPAEIGLLATLGIAEVAVHRRPRVAVLSTGDELVEPDAPLRPGAIRDSNRYALMAAAREAGAEAISMGMARDDVITSGGVSVGTRDLIKPILESLGTVHFGRIALKPGKPLTFATVGEKLAFGLPGNPVSALVTFEVFVRPTLLKMQGRRAVQRPRVEVEVEHSLARTPDRTEYQRALVRWQSGRLTAGSTGSQISSRLLSMVGANALLEIEPGEGTVPAGTRVPALLVGEVESSRATAKAAATIGPPIRTPAQTCAGVCAPSRTRAQPIRPSSGAASSAAWPNASARMPSAPAATAAWNEIFQVSVIASVAISPTTIAQTSATTSRGAPSQPSVASPATIEIPASVSGSSRCSRRTM